MFVLIQIQREVLMKNLTKKFNKRAFSFAVSFMVATLFITSPVLSQTGNPIENNKEKGKPRISELFGEQLPEGASWKGESLYVRPGDSVNNTLNHFLYVRPENSPAEVTGLSIPIRENPGPGQFRYITFSWIKWGNDLDIGIHFEIDETQPSENQKGKPFNYTYAAGKGNVFENALKVSNNGPGNWTSITRDLWKDFGDFTMTGVSFICPVSRDAGFDNIFLGTDPKAFEGAPQVLPTSVAPPQDITGEEDMSLSDDSTSSGPSVNVDWGAQIKAGGWMMYPLYLLGLVAIIIAVQRFMTAKESRLAPKELSTAVRNNLAKGDIKAAIAACDAYPSTLAESLRFILEHKNAGMDVVSQTAGDIAARDIRDHLNRIYPLSVIASLSPLLGLLGTIVGMIEAFALVAMYGDEGGAAILSDAISKALITTAAGLIIAAPCVAVYFMLKKRIMTLASTIEVEIENAITMLYLKEDSKALNTPKSEEHANII